MIEELYLCAVVCAARVVDRSLLLAIMQVGWVGQFLE